MRERPVWIAQPRVDAGAFAARIEDDPLLGHAVRHFAGWGGITGILLDVTPERLLEIAAGR